MRRPTNRIELASSFRGIGAELGVAAGAYSETILKRSRCQRLFSIDRWSDHHGAKEYRETAMRLGTLGGGRCVPLRMHFSEAVRLFPKWALDFVYIDGYAHQGQEGGKTLSQWWPKLKRGGIMAGHDYHPQWKATMDAVDAFVAKHGLVLHVTKPGDGADAYPSWWVIKPKTAAEEVAEEEPAPAPVPVHPPGRVMTGAPVRPDERVILVGNGPSMLLRGDWGDKIDAYDQVVRFNWYAIRGFEKQVGSKTTLWSTFGRGSRPRDEGEEPQRAIFIHGDNVGEKRFVFPVSEAWGISREFFNEVRDRVKARSKVPAAARKKDLLPSSGLVVALWLLEVHGVSQVTLAGFDHFSKKESGGHHYWLDRTFSKPPEHDGEAEAELFLELVNAGRVVYLQGEHNDS